jgi:hypothetical protein
VHPSNPDLSLPPSGYPLIVDKDSGRIYWLTAEFQVCSAPLTEHGLLDRDHVSRHGVSDPLTLSADRVIHQLNDLWDSEAAEDFDPFAPTETRASERAQIDLSRPIAYQPDVHCLYWLDGDEFMVAQLDNNGCVCDDPYAVDWGRAEFWPADEATIEAVHWALQTAGDDDTLRASAAEIADTDA